MWRPEKPAPSRFTEETQNSNPAAQTATAQESSQGNTRPSPTDSTIGEKLAAELDNVTRREREIRDLQEVTLRRVAELNVDQLRRILESME